MTETASPSLMSRVRIVLITIVAVVVTVLIFQNTETVNVRLLVTTVAMPRALLLVGTLAVGFGLGFLVGTMRRRKEALR